MITLEQRSQYQQLVDICVELDRLADGADLKDKNREPLDILVRNIFRRVVKCDTAIPLLVNRENPYGQYQLRSYGLTEAEENYTWSGPKKWRYYSQDAEHTLRILRRNGVDLVHSLQKQIKNKSIKDLQKYQQLIQFCTDGLKVNFDDHYSEITHKYLVKGRSLILQASPWKETGEDNQDASVKYIEVELEPGSGSLKCEIYTTEGSYDLIDRDSDYEFVNPLLFLRLDDATIQFVIFCLSRFKEQVHKDWSGGGVSVEQLIQKYGQYIVLEKLGE